MVRLARFGGGVMASFPPHYIFTPEAVYSGPMPGNENVIIYAGNQIKKRTGYTQEEPTMPEGRRLVNITAGEEPEYRPPEDRPNTGVYLSASDPINDRRELEAKDCRSCYRPDYMNGIELCFFHAMRHEFYRWVDGVLV